LLNKLPDGEFEVMDAIWSSSPPVTSRRILNRFAGAKAWKMQTVDSFLRRLLDRGFLRSEKPGKEREYYPTLSRDEYLRFETKDFIKQRHRSSLMSLVNTLFEDEALSDGDLDELAQWIQDRRT
jgi:predicted transcriptional regulator